MAGEDRREAVRDQIERAFVHAPYPGDAYLLGSLDGTEPEAEVGPFRGHRDWRELSADFLDAHAAALSFFSEGALRFFLPAFLRADLDEALDRADPVFTLTHGFVDRSIELPVAGRGVRRDIGRTALVNPVRYGAIRAEDVARMRLAVFCREEAQAIVRYLGWLRVARGDGVDGEAIGAALERFWFARAHVAPTAADLGAHQEALQAYLQVAHDVGGDERGE
ncbi:MAG: hypothetical protein GVY27_11040 [Deinococcus-Thermus bacterium]|jgi:hypothetical protein|nr:hypothetical protein [Deinococcota bacterium]